MHTLLDIVLIIIIIIINIIIPSLSSILILALELPSILVLYRFVIISVKYSSFSTLVSLYMFRVIQRVSPTVTPEENDNVELTYEKSLLLAVGQNVFKAVKFKVSELIAH